MSNATRGSHGSQGSAPDGRKSAPPKAQAVLCHTCLQPGHPYQSCTAQCCHCKATHNGGRCDAVPHEYYPFAQLPKQATGNAGLLKRVGERRAELAELKSEVSFLRSHLDNLLDGNDPNTYASPPEPPNVIRQDLVLHRVAAVPKAMEEDTPDQGNVQNSRHVLSLFHAAGHAIDCSDLVSGYKGFSNSKKLDWRKSLSYQGSCECIT
jgi:hypothetical protein